MPISVKCGCGQAFRAQDALAGKSVKCPKCSKPIAIPAAQAAAPKAAAPSGPKELSLDDLAMLDASSPAISGVMQPVGQPGGQAGGFQAAGFQPAGFQPAGFQQQPAGFQQGGFAFGQQPQPKAAEGGKGKLIALIAAGGAAVIAVVVAVIMLTGDDDKPDLSEKTGTGPQPPGVGPPPGPPGVPPNGPGPGGSPHPSSVNPMPMGNGNVEPMPGTTADPMNGSTGAAAVSGTGQELPIVRDTAAGKALVIPGAFSINAARPYFQWKFIQQITDQQLTASMYHCRQEDSPAGVMLMATSKTAARTEREQVVRQWIDALSGGLKASGLNNVQVALPSLASPVPDRVDVTITGAMPSGGAASIRCAMLFKKNTYAIVSIGTSQQETDTLFAVADTLKEVGESSGPSTPATARDFAQAVQEWHKRQEPIFGLRYIADPEFNSDEKRDQLRKPVCFSWMVDLLPYLDMQAEFDRLDFKHAAVESPNREVGSIVIPQFLNPANNRQKAAGFDEEEGLALTHFVGMAGVELAANDDAGLFPRNHPQAGVFGYAGIARMAEVTDGASQTIMVIGSDGIAAKPWIAGGGGTVRGARLGGPSGQESYFSDLGGSMFALEGQAQPGTLAMMVDGSVRFIPKGIDPAVFRSMCTIHGSDTVDLNAAPASEKKIGEP